MVSQVGMRIQVSMFMLIVAACVANKPLMRSEKDKRSSKQLSRPGSFDMPGAVNQKTAGQQAVSIEGSSLLNVLKHKEEPKKTSSSPARVHGAWSMEEDIPTGACEIDGDCIQSRNYPQAYDLNEGCTALTPATGTIKKEGYNVEGWYYDYVEFQPKSGGAKLVQANEDMPDSIELDASVRLTWTSDYVVVPTSGWNNVVEVGWRFCWEAAPVPMAKCNTCSCPTHYSMTDGAASIDCAAETCTSGDVNTCCDPPSTYDGAFTQVSGNGCKTSQRDSWANAAQCISSPNIDDSCSASETCLDYANHQGCSFKAPAFGKIVFEKLNTERDYDKLTIGSTVYMGYKDCAVVSMRPADIVLTAETDITWTSDVSVGRAGFKICLEESASLLEQTEAQVSASNGAQLIELKRGAQCTIPHNAENPNEKPCGTKTTLDDGEKCTPSCSDGYAAKDAEFECVDGVLMDGDEQANDDDLTCKPVS